jgi:hypothetical protein
MNVKVSIGEAVDKYSILQLKLKKIVDTSKLIEIQNEMVVLHECNKYIQQYAFYYKLLMYINEKIWDFTDIIKTLSIENTEFAKISNYIFEYNQKRFRIKNWFNLVTTSSIKEQKSYATTHCRIIVNTEQEIYDKIPEINYLCVEYDAVSFDCNEHCISVVKNIFKAPTIIYNTNDELYGVPNKNMQMVTVNIAKWCIPRITIGNFTTQDEREVFDLNPITYIVGGLLGDYIHSLSVVCENFYLTGRKGVLYLSNNVGDHFRSGIENTYKDTYNTIASQQYITEYKLHANEPYDCNLSEWRRHPNLYEQTWQGVYSMYNISWGKHPWIKVDKDNKWRNSVLVNTTNYRWPLLDFNLLYAKYGKDLIYISFDIKQYVFFCEKTGLHIPCVHITDFGEMCSAIASCKLFVGALSAPLTIAHATNTPRIVGLYGGADDYLNSRLNEIWDNVNYNI